MTGRIKFEWLGLALIFLQKAAKATVRMAIIRNANYSMYELLYTWGGWRGEVQNLPIALKVILPTFAK